MSPPDQPDWAARPPDAWPASPATAQRGRASEDEEEYAAIVRRAASLGIPAWRIALALGRPLPD